MPKLARKRSSVKVKKVLSRKKSSTNNHLLVKFVIFFVVFIGSALLLTLYAGYKLLNQRFTSAQSATNYSLQDTEIPTLVFVKIKDFSQDPVLVNEASIVILDKLNKKVIKLPLTGDDVLDIPGKFGKESFSKVFAFGSLDQQDKVFSGVQAVNRALFKTYGVNVNKYVFVDENTTHFFDNFFQNGGIFSLLKPEILSQLGTTIITNISLSEFNYIGGFVNSLPEDRIITITSTISGDEMLREIFLDTQFSSQAESIAVLNGSGVSGMAAFSARVIRNMGGRVVAISNSDTAFTKSFIAAQDPESYTVQTLSTTFNIKNIVPKETARNLIGNSEIDRADVVIMLGLDQD